MEFQALPWCDQRMYIEQLSIYQYWRDWHRWNQLSEDDKWYEEEPVKPMVLMIEESEEEAENIIAQGMPPDILS